jgi:Flp pilus assembly protein TadD
MKRTKVKPMSRPPLEQLEEGARAAGADRAAILRWGWALYAVGRHPEAAAAARDAQKLTSGDPEPGYLLGMALKASGDRAAAVAAFNNAAAEACRLTDTVRGAMLRRLAVGQANWLQRGEWDLEPETWVRT